MSEQFQGGRLAAQAIAAEGVDTIFTLCGGHVMPIYEGCRLEGVRVVDVRHEQSAAHAAEAWGRVRRSCGVAVVTAGPGVTGTVTAVANAFAAQAPLLVIGGARPLAQAERGALQEFDQLSLMKPITKWAAVCSSTERIPEYVATAFRHALATPRGPGVSRAADGHPLRRGRRRSPARRPHEPRRGPREIRQRSSAQVSFSRRRSGPAIVAGSGVWWDGAADELDVFARHGQRPGVPQRRRAGLAPSRPPAALPARAPRCPGGRRRRVRRSARRSISGSATGRSVRTRSCTCTATRVSSAATGYPTSRSRAIAARARESVAARAPAVRARRPGSSRCGRRRRPGGPSTGPRSSPRARRSTTIVSAPSSTASSSRARS